MWDESAQLFTKIKQVFLLKITSMNYILIIVYIHSVIDGTDLVQQKEDLCWRNETFLRLILGNFYEDCVSKVQRSIKLICGAPQRLHVSYNPHFGTSRSRIKNTFLTFNAYLFTKTEIRHTLSNYKRIAPSFTRFSALILLIFELTSAYRDHVARFKWI